MTRFLSIAVLFIIFASCAAAQNRPAATQPHDYARWAKEMDRLAKQDEKAPPEKGGSLFTGSSTIARWKTLAQDFPDAKTINHGFGGSMICDATYYADRIIFPFEPKMVFFRAGGNDIHAGKSPEEVFQDYKDFVAKVHEKLPETTIVFIGLCPAPSRWAERDANKKLNELVEAYTGETPGLKYVESYDLSLDKDGNPREELFVADKLHFNADGYKLLIDRVRPFIAKPGADGK